MAFQKAILCGCTGKGIFSGFIQTMQFVEKQHNLGTDPVIYMYVICTIPFKMCTAPIKNYY